MFNFKDKVVLITGATNGIGKEILEHFLTYDCKIIATGNKTTNKNFFKKFNSSKILGYHKVDFKNLNSIELFCKNLEKYKKIDICINNAGINKLNSINKIDKDFIDTLNVNVVAPLKISKVVTNKMKKFKFGKIVNISSIWGKKSKDRRVSYSVSKNAINGLTISSAVELGKYNILINSVSPGFVDTNLTRKNLSSVEINNLKRQIPLGRLARSSDIVPIIIFLCSEMNTYITGQVIYVDGGFVNV